MFNIFESQYQRSKDAMEVRSLYLKYGDETVSVLKVRLKDGSLSSRDRRHWKRIIRKARAARRDHLSQAASSS